MTASDAKEKAEGLAKYIKSENQIGKIYLVVLS
jgi:hypothetical protein